MAFITGDFYSEAMGMYTEFHAILPEPEILIDENYKYPTLYLIHGGTYDHTSIIRDTTIYSIINEVFPELIVIMPFLDFSYGTDYHGDYKYAYNYKKFLSEELIEIVRTLFPSSELREDTAVYGWSAGAYAALTSGITNPNVYGYVGSQCGMVDKVKAVETRDYLKHKYSIMFGKELKLKNTDDDIFYLTNQLQEMTEPKPALFHARTDDDYLGEMNEKFYEFSKDLDIDYTTVKTPGIHGWGLHDAGLKEFIKWLKLRMEGDKK